MTAKGKMLPATAQPYQGLNLAANLLLIKDWLGWERENTQKNSEGEPLPKGKYRWVSNLLFSFLISFKSLRSSSLLSLRLEQFSCCLPLFKCIYFIIQRLLLIL